MNHFYMLIDQDMTLTWRCKLPENEQDKLHGFHPWTIAMGMTIVEEMDFPPPTNGMAVYRVARRICVYEWNSINAEQKSYMKDRAKVFLTHAKELSTADW